MRLFHKWGYTNGYECGVLDTKDQYERHIALLTEQLAESRSLTMAANHRADATFDQLMLQVGRQPVSQAAAVERQMIVQANIDRHGVVKENAFEEFPIGHEKGSYKTVDEARLDVH